MSIKKIRDSYRGPVTAKIALENTIKELMNLKKAKSFIYLDLAFEYKRQKKGPGS